MKVFSYDQDGYFTCQGDAQPNPRRPGDFLMPAFSTETEPPAATDTQEPKWNGTAWELVSSRAYLIEQKQLSETTNDFGVKLYDLNSDGVAVARDAQAVSDDTHAAATAQLKAKRNALISQTDWLVTRQAEQKVLSDADYATLLTYRQALRDFPATVTDPTQPYTFPAKPAFV